MITMDNYEMLEYWVLLHWGMYMLCMLLCFNGLGITRLPRYVNHAYIFRLL